MNQNLVGVLKAFKVGDSIVLVIPKGVRKRHGIDESTRFILSVEHSDGTLRLIYQRL